MAVLKVLSKVLRILTTLSFSALIIVVVIQIASRYMPFSFVWTEELTRYLFIYSIAFGAPLAMEAKEYINVDLLVNLLPNKLKEYYHALIYFVLGVFTAWLVFYSYTFVLLGQNQTSAALGIEVFYVNLSMLIMFIFISLYSFLNTFYIIKDTMNKDKEGVNK